MQRALFPSLAVLVFALASRCPPVAALGPSWASKAVIALVGAVLFVVGLIERSTERSGPGALWMQLPRPLGLCLAAGMSFFTTVFAQELGVSLGPVDPSFPAAVPVATSTMWFLMFTVGFLGIGMMAAPSLMVPLLRVLTWPLSKAPTSIAVPLGLLVGALFSGALVAGAAAPSVVELTNRVRAAFDANPTAGTLFLVGIGVVPQVIGAFLPKRDD